MRPDYLEKWERQQTAFDRALQRDSLSARLARMDYGAQVEAAANFDHMVSAFGAVSSFYHPDVIQQIEALNQMSERLAPYLSAVSSIEPSVIQSLTAVSEVFETTISKIKPSVVQNMIQNVSVVASALRSIDTSEIWDSLSVFQRFEEQMARGVRALEGFGPVNEGWSRTIGEIYADDLDISPITEEEFEETVEQPAIQDALADLNASPVGQNTIGQIFAMLEQNKRELDEIKAQNEELHAQNEAMAADLQVIKENTRKKSLTIRFLFFLLMFIFQQLFAPVVDEFVVKPAREVITSVRQNIHTQLRESDPELAGYIRKTCMMTVHPSVVLRSAHGETAAPFAYIPFGHVVQIVGRHKKWRLVNYVNGAGHCYCGWTQNWKLDAI